MLIGLNSTPFPQLVVDFLPSSIVGLNSFKRPPSIRQAVRWIAQLAGFLARKGDGEPGLKTLWRGIGVLHHLLEGVQLAAKT
jgi:hypothetical protein